MKRILIKMSIIWKIVTNQYKHCVVMNITEEQLINLFSDEDFDVEILYYGLHPYVFHRMINQCSTVKDDLDMILDKAAFEAESELHNQRKQQ